MRKYSLKLCLLPSMILFFTESYCQLNPVTNGAMHFQSQAISYSSTEENDIEIIYGGGILCNPNTFWAITIGGAIEEFTINGSSLVSNGIILPGPVDPSLAYCNNISGGVFSPTFYTTVNTSFSSYYNGSGWTTSSTSVAPNRLINAAGSGNYLYYMEFDSAAQPKPVAITRFNGTTFTSVYNFSPTQRTTLADLAVDGNGNCWLFTGHSSNPSQTDTITVISPTGTIVIQYPFNFNTSNGFGMFIMGGTIYIGFGSSHPTYPNSLLPLTISGTTINIGTALPFPNILTAYGDLAGCNAGTPMSVQEFQFSEETIIYPNPADELLVISHQLLGKEKSELKLFDVLGKEVFHSVINNKQSLINVSSLKNGIYFLHFSSGNKSVTHKLIVQHYGK
jgi:Secretion system C-terminal sorting domain